LARPVFFYVIVSVCALSLAVASNASAAGQVSKKVYDSIIEAQAKADAKDFESALDILEPLSARKGLSEYEKANVLNYIGFVYYNMEDIPKAIQTYEQMLTIPSLDTAPRKQTTYTLTQLYMLQEQYEAALEKLNEWRRMEANPSPDSFVLSAQILFKLERYADMVPNLRAAISLAERNGQPSKEDWWTLLRFALDNQGRRDELADALEQMIATWPTETNFESALVAFFKAADAGRFVDAAERLLTDFPETEVVSSIHVAAARGDNEATRRLVASGTSVELESSAGFTPLTIAARFGLGSTVDLLLELGALIDGSGDPGSTPIIHAAAGGHPAIAERLWRAGADLAIYEESEIKLLPLLARTGDADVLQRLAEAHPALLETSGSQALTEAARTASLPAFDLLLNLGAMPVETEERSTLGAAVLGGNIDILERLVALGADPGAPVWKTRSALHVAVINGHTGVVQWLLEQDVAVNGLDAQGVPPLTHAIADGRSDIVALLAAAGADLSNTHYRDYDALTLAAATRNPDTVSVLLEAGAKPQGKLEKFSRWKLKDVRKFLKQHNFERIASGDAETWSASRQKGTTAEVTLPTDSRELSLPELVRIVKESRLGLDDWLAAV
jgi:ankyrin repeat protein